MYPSDQHDKCRANPVYPAMPKDAVVLLSDEAVVEIWSLDAKILVLKKIVTYIRNYLKNKIELERGTP